MSGLDEHGNPVCEPLISLREVIDWSADKFRFHERPTSWTFNYEKQDRTEKENGKRPQVLVCHDMEGGYLEDRFAQGCDKPSAYRFYHWHLIDTFVYFSHQFITIPPSGWINAAHRNCVQILGTIITEWEDGANICKQLLASKQTIDLVAAKLADIAVVFGFDGWLVNIENVISADSIQDLQYFVQELTNQCHSRQRAFKVLWYDSVTKAGDLLWQNELNEENEMFFSACDGIFLNYAITETTLENSMKKAEAVGRCFDVYVGVDVFGRATPGGGGFNCRQVLEMISKHGLSCALFAQAWVYEKHGAKLFDANEIKFWGLLKDVLPVRSVSAPFSTSFCQGYGQRHYLKGKIIREKPWHNLLLQQLQPCCYENCAVSLTTSDAYMGGGCVRLAANSADKGMSMIRLFKVSVEQKEQLVLSAVWKSHQPLDTDFGLAFVLRPTTNKSAGAWERTMVLSNEKYRAVDEEDWKQCLLGRDRPGEEWKGSVRFTEAGCLEEKDERGWTTSAWEFDTDWLLEDRDGRCEMDLFVVVVCSHCGASHAVDVTTPQSDSSILLGNLQMQQKSLSETSPKQPNLSNLICLEVNTEQLISKQNMSSTACALEDLKMIAKCELDNLSLPDLHRPLKPNESNLKCPCVFKRFTIASSSAQCDESLACCLHVLTWTMCDIDTDKVDYCLLFSGDENGLERFIGCSCANVYVSRCKEDEKVVTYAIQPVIKSSSLPGQKISFQLK